MSLALCLQAASQAPQHFRSPEMQVFQQTSACSGRWVSNIVPCHSGRSNSTFRFHSCLLNFLCLIKQRRVISRELTEETNVGYMNTQSTHTWLLNSKGANSLIMFHFVLQQLRPLHLVACGRFLSKAEKKGACVFVCECARACVCVCVCVCVYPPESARVCVCLQCTYFCW